MATNEMTIVTSATKLRLRLAKTFEELSSGSLKAKEAKELANIAGKMINSAKVQVEYYALRKEAPIIEFLKDDTP